MESGLFSLYNMELLESQNMFSVFGFETLETYSVTSSGCIPLYICGSLGEQALSGIPCYIHGSTNPCSGSIPLYTCGSIPDSGSIPLYMFGHGESTGVRPLFIHGYDTQQTGIPLYMFGSVLVETGIPLYMYGYDTKETGIPLYMAGHLPDSGQIPLYIQGHGDSNNGMYLYIGDTGERIDSSIPLYLQNPGGFSGMPLAIWGIGYGTNIDQTLNGYAGENSMLLFIDGGGTQGSIPLFMPGPTGGVDNSVPLYMPSSVESSGVTPLFIDSYDYDTRPINLYTHGF